MSGVGQNLNLAKGREGGEGGTERTDGREGEASGGSALEPVVEEARVPN